MIQDSEIQSTRLPNVFICLRVCFREIRPLEIRLLGQQDPACLIRNDKMNKLRTEGYHGVPVKHQDGALTDAIKWLNKLCVSTFFLKHPDDVTTLTVVFTCSVSGMC